MVFFFLLTFFLGKVLTDAMTIGSAQVSNGSKIMLMASLGLHQGVFNVFYCICMLLISGEIFMICVDFSSLEFRVCCMLSFVSQLSIIKIFHLGILLYMRGLNP